MFSHIPETERPGVIQNKVSSCHDCDSHMLSCEQVGELEAEIVRVEEFVENTQTQLDCGHGNQDYLKMQLVSHGHVMIM